MGLLRKLFDDYQYYIKFKVINKQNFVQYAIKAYDNPQCVTLEQFNKDVKKFSSVKKLLNSEQSDGEFIRLTLNSIVYLYNIFSAEDCTIMLFSKVRQEHWYKLKTYLTFLNRMPEKIPELHIKNSDLKICPKISTHLRII